MAKSNEPLMHNFSRNIDLSRKLAKLHKENTAPLGVQIQKSCQRSILNTHTNKRARSRNSLLPEAAAAQSHSPPQQQHQPPATTASASAAGQLNGNRKRMSMSDVSDMLFELYRAKAPKNQQQATMSLSKFGQTSPTSAETHEPSTIAAIATNGARDTDTESKNLLRDEMVPKPVAVGNININNSNGNSSGSSNANAGAPFHPRIKYTLKQLPEEGAQVGMAVNMLSQPQPQPQPQPTLTAIPTSVVVVPTSPQIDVKPLIHPTTGLVISVPSSTAAGVASVIKAVPSAAAAAAASGSVVPPAAAIAAALLRDGYHNFQQQLRAQELLKHQGRVQLTVSSNVPTTDASNATPTKLLQSFLRQQRDQRNSECDNERDDIASDTNDGDDEDDSRYNGFDDIHLVESSKTNYGNSSLPNLFQAAAATSTPATSAAPTADYLSDESQKYMIAAQAQAFRNFEFTLADYGNGASRAGSVGGGGDATNSNDGGADGAEPVYECRHCGKKYRWKSTLRRHENVECGGKEPSHQCPYCPYKSKQRGNLGVHVRKHHSNLPQLASKRRSKYSQKMESGASSANASDDSSSKLIIDCSK